MSRFEFILKPFSLNTAPEGLKIGGQITRRSGTLAIRYVLQGQQTELAVPAPADNPSRRDRLWEEMCLEFFLANEDPRGCYWEFNLSPAGHWNVYHFSDYRQGMQEEPAFTALSFDLQKEQDSLQIHLELDLSPIVALDCGLQVGISAVIERRDGMLSYWALNHPGPRPDFHHRGSFSIDL